jgi:xanthine dehydrogenase YagR molybdenum-binding subunit
MTHRNAAKLNPAPPFMSKPKAAGPDDLPIMQDDRVHWNGQPVAIVLAETQEQAEHAQTLIRVTYEEQDPVISLAAAKAKGTESGVFMGEPLKQTVGDAEAALAAAPHKVDVTYTTPRHHHAPIELHACTLAWEGDTLRIHDASQAVAHEAWTIAEVFGLKEKQVRLTSPFVGAASAASFFGSTRFWRRRRGSSPAVRCGSCSLARGCFVSSAAAPSLSSAWRLAPRPMAGSTP